MTYTSLYVVWASRSLVYAGESLVILEWAHTQYGNILAVGTSEGRVLLFSQRPKPSALRQCSNGTATADIDMDDGTQHAENWQLDNVLLDGSQLKAVSQVR